MHVTLYENTQKVEDNNTERKSAYLSEDGNTIIITDLVYGSNGESIRCNTVTLSIEELEVIINAIYNHNEVSNKYYDE